MRPHPSPDVQALLDRLHPNWVQALQQAVHTKGQEGFSKNFSCLTVCPNCGQALRVDVLERRVEYLTDEPPEVYDYEYELYCPHCVAPADKLSDALEDYFTLEMLNQDLLGDWLEDWLPRPELLDDVLRGDPFAALFLHLIGEAYDLPPGHPVP